MSTGTSNSTVDDKLAAQQAFLAEGKWESLMDCAQAFYDKFSFHNAQTATDIFRRRIRSLDSMVSPWAKAFHAETETQAFRAAEREYLDTKKIKKRTRIHQSTKAVASALGNKFARGALRSSYQVLQTGRDKIAELAMTEIASTTTSAQPSSLAQEHEADNDTEVETGLATLESELPLSRAKESPFYELVEYIYKKVALPNVPSNLTPIHSEMFRLARDELNKPGDVTKKKHVFCLVSGIVNTLTPIGRSLSISSAVEASSIAPALQYESPSIRTLQEELLAALYPDPEEPGSTDFSNLRRTVRQRLADLEQEPRRTRGDKEHYAVLEIFDLILFWLAIRKFEKPSPEHVFVGSWSDVFNALFQGANLRVIPGELVSEASRKNRQIANGEFGGTTVDGVGGRKVDLTLRIMVAGGVWEGEVAVFEGKRQVSDKACRIQQQKSVRLNAAILDDLEDRGLDTSKTYPVIAETRALAVDFYTLRRQGDIFGAGRATVRRVWLPAHPTELKAFLLSDSLQVLLGFRTLLSHTL
ncbi:hypothetical protein EC957_008486 [Mortierella hygrophila]|uniref:Uncharacterized protein n=1 Tax=Mortierella hygrophila TaxID=979708 RepID=A0A9P6EX49_9FUNG|nr:hypothetical protein EC957_008486 [Mortierella hygrophila]